MLQARLQDGRLQRQRLQGLQQAAHVCPALLLPCLPLHTIQVSYAALDSKFCLTVTQLGSPGGDWKARSRKAGLQAECLAYPFELWPAVGCRSQQALKEQAVKGLQAPEAVCKDAAVL